MEQPLNPVISADGSTIAYVSYATNLVPGQSGLVDTTDVFVYDVQTGVNALVSGASGSASATADNYSDSPSIDAAGAAIAFRSSASNLIVGQTGPGGSNIFLLNSTGIALISHAAGDPQTSASGNSTIPVVDGDGSLVAYLSTANNLVTGQSAGVINNVFGWTSSNDQNFLASGQNGSPTVISQSPAFLPIVSRDPFFFFSVTGTLLTNGVGSTNAYGNTLISIVLTTTGLADGSVGTLSASSVLVGQLVSVQFGLAAGGPRNDNNLFAVGATQANNTATLSFTGNVGSQAFFTVVVQMATPLGTVEQSFTLNASAGGGLITDDYLNRLYSDVLQRQADPGGLGNFSAALDAGSLSCGAVAAALVGSQEFRINEVANAYLDILARPPDPGGLSFWVGFLSNQPLVRLQIQFYGGAEFFNKNGGTNTAFVDAIYLDILHRPADAGAAGWIQALNNGASLGAVANGILGSSESVGAEVTGLYQNYLHRAPDPGGFQNNVNAILQGSATYEKELVGFVASPEYQNNAGGDLNQHFVANLYFDILGRAADSGGLTNFTGALDNGTLSRSQVVTTLLNSTEYRTRVINNLYLEYLGRAADNTGLANGLNILSRAGTDEQVADVLLGSGEFFSDNGGNDTGFVHALYREVLQRSSSPSAQEVAGWVATLQNGASPAAVAGAFLATDEYHRAIVNNFYLHYLHRAADPGGLNGFAGALDAGHTDESVIANLVTSAEYFSR